MPFTFYILRTSGLLGILKCLYFPVFSERLPKPGKARLVLEKALELSADAPNLKVHLVNELDLSLKCGC